MIDFQLVKSAKYYFPIVLLVILTAISFQNSLFEQIEKDLAGHMIVEHLLFFSLGALSVVVAERFLKLLVSSQRKRGKYQSAYRSQNSNTIHYNNIQKQNKKYHLQSRLIAHWSKFLRGIFFANRYGITWVATILILMTFWHIPSVFDFASVHEATHILRHLSFAIVGAAGFIATRMVGESFNLFLILSLVGMMGFIGIIFSLLDSQVYIVYSLDSHNNAGTYMIILSILLLLVALPLYLIKRSLFHLNAGKGKSRQDKLS